MTKKRPLGLPSAKLVAIAAIAGLFAGAVAVYVKEAGSGNGGALVAEAGCETSPAALKALDPFIKGQVAAIVAASPPRILQNLTFKDASGTDKTLKDFKGKALLVNLWATWCVPCREEMPALNGLQAAKGGNQFDVVAINIDSGGDEKPKTFLSDNGINHLGFYRDSSMGVFNALKKEGLVFGLPATLVIDKNGCLLGSMNGPAVWDSNDAKALIDKLTSL